MRKYKWLSEASTNPLQPTVKWFSVLRSQPISVSCKHFSGLWMAFFKMKKLTVSYITRLQFWEIFSVILSSLQHCNSTYCLTFKRQKIYMIWNQNVVSLLKSLKATFVVSFVFKNKKWNLPRTPLLPQPWCWFSVPTHSKISWNTYGHHFHHFSASYLIHFRTSITSDDLVAKPISHSHFPWTLSAFGLTGYCFFGSVPPLSAGLYGYPFSVSFAGFFFLFTGFISWGLCPGSSSPSALLGDLIQLLAYYHFPLISSASPCW
jgi:hypothetical protein